MQLRLQRDVGEKAVAAAQREADEQNTSQLAAHQAALAAGGSGKKKGKAPKAPKPVPPRQVSVGSIGTHVELRFTHVRLDLSRGCCFLLAALGKLKLMPAYESEFMPLHRRFDLRFSPFHSLIRPPPFSFDFFEKECARMEAIAVADLLQSAANHFKGARAKMDGPLKADPRSEGALSAAQRAEAMCLVKVAVSNSVVILSLQRSPPSALSVAKFSFAAHPSFVSVSVGPPAKPTATDKPAADKPAADK